MRIALLRQRVTGLGGAETTLGHLARGFAAQGHEVTVLGTEGHDEGQRALGPGVAYLPVPVWGGKTGRLLTFALNSRRLLAQGPPRLVLSLERTLFQDVYRAGDGCHREWLARRAPYLSGPARLAQELSLFHRTLLLLERRLFAAPTLKGVIANSRQVQEEIRRHYGVTPERLRVIYNGLDHGKFRPLPPQDREGLRRSLGAGPRTRVVLFLGSGFKRKGLPYLMEAFGRLKDKDVLLWVVGRGAAAPYLRQAARLGVAERVRFWGPQAEVARFYQAAAVLALPTIYDPCSNVALEALACGAPVVTTAGNGAKEVLTPGENGAVLARPDDVSGLAAALDAFLLRDGDPGVRAGAAAAVAGLTWEAAVSQTLAALAQAAAEMGF